MVGRHCNYAKVRNAYETVQVFQQQALEKQRQAQAVEKARLAAEQAERQRREEQAAIWRSSVKSKRRWKEEVVEEVELEEEEEVVELWRRSRKSRDYQKSKAEVSGYCSEGQHHRQGVCHGASRQGRQDRANR